MDDNLRASQEVLDYIESTSDIGRVFVDSYRERAEAAKRGFRSCKKHQCSHYIEDDFDGRGYRDVYCELSGHTNSICPHIRGPAFVLRPPYLPDEDGVIDVNRGINKKYLKVYNEVYGKK